MKKSDLYYLAQKAILTSAGLDSGSKLEILREFMSQEDIYRLVEKKEEKERVAQAV